MKLSFQSNGIYRLVEEGDDISCNKIGTYILVKQRKIFSRSMCDRKKIKLSFIVPGFTYSRSGPKLTNQIYPQRRLRLAGGKRKKILDFKFPFRR